MPNPRHEMILRRGSVAWNSWRLENPALVPDLSRIRLGAVDLSGADLRFAQLPRAELQGINLTGSLLVGADLRRSDLSKAGLAGAKLQGAKLYRAGLSDANLESADLQDADLARAALGGCKLRHATLRRAVMEGADLGGADLSYANLTGADLSKAQLIGTNLHSADLTGCRVYGASVWNVCLANTVQTSLIITPQDEPSVEVDNLEVAQFIYLILNNSRLRELIDTITSKVVLILGRFTPERKAILDLLRGELRRMGYSPVLFDFDKPTNLDLTETITLLARMSRFIFADISEPKSTPHELASIVPDVAVPVLPIVEAKFEDRGSAAYSMFRDLMKYPWVLGLRSYIDAEGLVSSLPLDMVGPAEAKRLELLRTKNGLVD